MMKSWLELGFWKTPEGRGPLILRGNEMFRRSKSKGLTDCPGGVERTSRRLNSGRGPLRHGAGVAAPCYSARRNWILEEDWEACEDQTKKSGS